MLLVEHVLDGVSLGEFACKRIPVGNDHGWLEKVLVEVQLLQRLNHPNLVSYQHVWLEDAQITSFGPSVPCIFILQQYCNAGDLHDYVVGSIKSSVNPQDLKERMRRRSKGQPDVPTGPERPRTMPFDEIFSFFRQLTTGLHHLHSNGYIHRDLKPSNCLLHCDGQKLTVHVSDFGEVQDTNAKRMSTGATGTLSYCAPEVLRRDGPGGQLGDFSTKSDIFSLGMIVYFMCFGHLPYANADEVNDENEDVEQLRAEVSMWTGFDDSRRSRSDLPARLYSFLRRLLSPDPAERPSTERILQEIKAGNDVDGSIGQIPDLGDPGPRITSVASPARQVPPQPGPRTLSSGSTRPGLSSFARHRSSGDVIQSPSPQEHNFVSDSPNRSESGVVLRSRKVEMPLRTLEQTDQTSVPPMATTKPIARLIMPPPSTHRHRFRNLLFARPPVIAFKSLAFCVKLITLSRPCAPYATSPWAFYTLMCFSVLDFVIDRGLAASLLLLIVHMTLFATAVRWGQFCDSRSLLWEAEQ